MRNEFVKLEDTGLEAIPFKGMGILGDRMVYLEEHCFNGEPTVQAHLYFLNNLQREWLDLVIESLPEPRRTVSEIITSYTAELSCGGKHIFLDDECLDEGLIEQVLQMEFRQLA